MSSISEEAMHDFSEKARHVPKEVLRDLDETARKIDGFIASFQLKKGSRVRTSDIMRSTEKMYNEALSRDRPHKGTVISIKRLRESAKREHSSIEQISEPMTEELMKYYKGHCKKAGVQFSILRERSDGKKDTYYVFFKSKDASLIKGCIERGMRDYKADLNRSKDEESITKKLDKYIKIVKERDAKKAAKEKIHQKGELNR